MKLMHISDLHIGKRIFNFPLWEDQKHILNQILEIMDREQPDALMISGDVYDRSSPSGEAVKLLDTFLTQLAQRGKPVMIISGNHDSAQRLCYASDFFKHSSIYIAPVYNGHIEPVCLQDEYGPVYFYLMPYVHPEQLAVLFPEKKILNANDALQAVISEIAPDPLQRNVALSHQFIAGGATCDSERRSIGTLEDVDASLYDAFDYVALGHLHKAQAVGREDGTMRYCGTPLMYSRSELGTPKSVTMVEIREKGKVQISTLPLEPLRALQLERGLFEDLLQQGPKPGMENDFYLIVLTDETDIPAAAARLRERFPGLLGISYDNSRTRNEDAFQELTEGQQERSPVELLSELYMQMHGEPMEEEALQFVQDILKKMEGDHHEAD